MIGNLRTFSKNFYTHMKRVITRGETPVQAWAAMRNDGRKWARAFESPGAAQRRRHARTLVRTGRQYYNNGDCERAEELFREASLEDPQFTLAFTYLGHALFRCGKLTEAKAAWKRAAEQDPDSDAGRKAAATLRHVNDQCRDVVEQLQERVERT